MPGQNTELMTAYGATSYFTNLIASKGSIWNKSTKLLDLMTRPYPHIGGNQLDVQSGGWKYCAAANTTMGQWFDFISGINPGGDKQSEMSTSRANVVSARNTVQAVAATVKDPYYTTISRPPLYCMPYHGNDSQDTAQVSGNNADGESNMAQWCTDNNYSLRNSATGNTIRYASYTGRLWFGCLVQEMRNQWAHNALNLMTWDATGFDGVFADNSVYSTTLLLDSGTGATVTSFTNPGGGTYTILQVAEYGWNYFHRELLSTTYAGPNCIIVGNSYPYRAKYPSSGTSPYYYRHFCMLEEQNSGPLNSQPNWASSDLWSVGQAITYSEQSVPLMSCSTNFSGYTQTLYPQRICTSLVSDSPLVIDVDSTTLLPEVNTWLPRLGKVGYPIGDRTLVSGSGFQGLFRRDFTHAIVWANTTDSTTYSVTIPTDQTYKDVYGNTISGTISVYGGGGDNSAGRAGGLVIKKTVYNQPTSPPTAPNNVNATVTNPGGIYQFNITWTDASSDETGFYIAVSSDNGVSWSANQSVTAGTQAYVYSMGQYPANQTYLIRVGSYNAGGTSWCAVNKSIAISGAPPSPNPPAAPTGLGVTLRRTADVYYLDVTWTDNATNETSYGVGYSTNDTTWTDITGLAPDLHAYSINLGMWPANATYYVSVGTFNAQAPDGVWNSGADPSVVLSGAPTQPTVPAPTLLTMGQDTVGGTTYYAPFPRNKTVYCPSGETIPNYNCIQIPLGWTMPTGIYQPDYIIDADQQYWSTNQYTNTLGQIATFEEIEIRIDAVSRPTWNSWSVIKGNLHCQDDPNGLNSTVFMVKGCGSNYDIAITENVKPSDVLPMNCYYAANMGVKLDEPVGTYYFRVRYFQYVSSDLVNKVYSAYSNEYGVPINPTAIYGIVGNTIQITAAPTASSNLTSDLTLFHAIWQITESVTATGTLTANAIEIGSLQQITAAITASTSLVGNLSQFVRWLITAPIPASGSLVGSVFRIMYPTSTFSATGTLVATASIHVVTVTQITASSSALGTLVANAIVINAIWFVTESIIATTTLAGNLLVFKNVLGVMSANGTLTANPFVKGTSLVCYITATTNLITNPKVFWNATIQGSQKLTTGSAAGDLVLATVPTAPTGVTLTERISLSLYYIDVLWTDTSNNEFGFYVDLSSDNGVTWSEWGSDYNSTSFSIPMGQFPANQQYVVRVGSWGTVGTSWSDNEYITIQDAPEPTSLPQAPSEVGASSHQGSDGNFFIDVVWVDNSSNEASNYVEISRDGGASWPLRALANADLTTYSINLGRFPTNQTYYVRVGATNESGTVYCGVNATAVISTAPTESQYSDELTLPLETPTSPNSPYKWQDLGSTKWTNSGTRYYAQNNKWGTETEISGNYLTPTYDLGSTQTSSFLLNYDVYKWDASQTMTINIRTSEDNITWSNWNLYTNGIYTCRYFQFQILFSSTLMYQMYIANMHLEVDVPDRIEYYRDINVVDANAGYTIIFSTDEQSKIKSSFSMIPGVVATPKHDESMKLGISYINKTKDAVTIRIFNIATGTFVSGTCDIIVKGF